MNLVGGKGDAAESIKFAAVVIWWRCWAPSEHFINVSALLFPSSCPHHFLPLDSLFSGSAKKRTQMNGEKAAAGRVWSAFKISSPRGKSTVGGRDAGQGGCDPNTASHVTDPTAAPHQGPAACNEHQKNSGADPCSAHKPFSIGFPPPLLKGGPTGKQGGLKMCEGAQEAGRPE